MKTLQDYQQAECRRLLRKAAKKHPEQAIVDRMARAAEYLDPKSVKDCLGRETIQPSATYRQGESDSPGHIIYWVASSESYFGIDDPNHAAPPFYRVRIGANGDNHACDCKDFANGAPEINGKKYCKHVIIARTLEYLRDHPVARPREGIHDAMELMALEAKATAAGIDLESAETRREMISNPQKFIDLIADRNGLKPELALA